MKTTPTHFTRLLGRVVVTSDYCTSLGLAPDSWALHSIAYRACYTGSAHVVAVRQTQRSKSFVLLALGHLLYKHQHGVSLLFGEEVLVLHRT